MNIEKKLLEKLLEIKLIYIEILIIQILFLAKKKIIAEFVAIVQICLKKVNP